MPPGCQHSELDLRGRDKPVQGMTRHDNMGQGGIEHDGTGLEGTGARKATGQGKMGRNGIRDWTSGLSGGHVGMLVKQVVGAGVWGVLGCGGGGGKADSKKIAYHKHDQKNYKDHQHRLE